MTVKDAQWIRLNEISKMAQKILDDRIANRNLIKSIDIEVSAMLRSFSNDKRFFKRLS